MDEPREHRLPSVFHNGTSAGGAALAGLSLLLILFLIAIEALSSEHSPYLGIITFIILPVFLVLGLLLIAFGALRQRRRRRLGIAGAERLPRIDLNQPAQLRATVIFISGTVLLLMLTAFGSYKAFEYTESDAFCGTVCHEVMKPEWTAYQESPHARVGCVQCHIGPGAEWFVKSKLSGAYQVYSVAFDKYPRPIETPVSNLRPSRDTCEQCHWPAHFSGEKMVVHDYWPLDEGGDHWRLHLLMKIGGGGGGLAPAHGSHWHVSGDVEVTYIATDHAREEIPWVRLRLADGTEKIFRDREADVDDAELQGREVRLMDCIDCHNRPSHQYDPPARLIDRALSNGLIAADLPGIKGVLVDLMEDDYATEAEALEAIGAGVRDHYAEEHPAVAAARADAIAAAAERARFLFRTNIFPEMNTSWREFPDHIGHLHTDGCFRCHGGNHVSDEGDTISRDCELCHGIVRQERIEAGEVVALADEGWRHPEDIGEEWREISCSECHGP